MSVRLLVGDCRETLPALAADSVQSVITSPPYYGLRDYGTPPLVWGGDAEHAHEWTAVPNPKPGGHNGWDGNNKNPDGTPRTSRYAGVPYSGSTSLCSCGAWLGSLGLEPTPELYLEHLVEVFRQVRRVLRPDGVCFINIGDSYSGSGNGSNDYRANGSSLSKNDLKYQGQKPAGSLPAKNLLMMPARVAMALQADGWWLRSMIPWLKRNSMPESVQDRPATAVEYVFLLSKSARYHWDADAVRMPAQDWGTRDRSANKYHGDAMGTNGQSPHRGLSDINFAERGRSRRNSDWFFESWQGLMLDEQDDPLALVVNPQPFSGAHFATFPPKLVEPMIKASTSEKGQCPECGAPWVRVVERTGYSSTTVTPKMAARIALGFHGAGVGTHEPGWRNQPPPESKTTGWRPSCACRRPSTIDPSAHDGTGTERETLRDLRGDYASEASAPPADSVLLSQMSLSGTEGQVDQSGNTIQEGQRSLDLSRGSVHGSFRIRTHPDTGTPDGQEEWLRGGAPTELGKSEWFGTSTGGIHRSSSERGQERQPPGESARNTQTEPQSGAAYTGDSGQTSRRRNRTTNIKSTDEDVLGEPYPPVPQVILDPFFGAGTVGLVADRLGRNAIGCELKSDYVDMGASRVKGDAPLFTEIVA